jgi:hypothetical protein
VALIAAVAIAFSSWLAGKSLKWQGFSLLRGEFEYKVALLEWDIYFKKA